MTIREAAKLVNRTERTISRWLSDGCRLDEDSLLVFSEKMDCRARGRSKTRWHQREEKAYVASKSSAVTPTPLAKLLEGVPDGRYCALPCPASDELQIAAVCEALEKLVEAFRRRVVELEAIGHAHSVERADDDYRDLLADVRDIRDILAGYDD
jgi:hypothetical protein